MRYLLLLLLIIDCAYPSFAQKKKEEALARAMLDLEYTNQLEKAKEADALHQFTSAESLYSKAWEDRHDPQVLQRRFELRRMLGDTAGYCMDLSYNGNFLDLSKRMEHKIDCLDKDSADLAFYGLSPQRYPDIVKVVRTKEKKNGEVQYILSDRYDTARVGFLVRGADTLFMFADISPEYPGGAKEMYKHWRSISNYPDDAFEGGISGKVYVSFDVGLSGVLSNQHVVRSAYPSLDEEALRMIKAMPDWTPGTYRGSPVPYRIVVPVSFVLH